MQNAYNCDLPSKGKNTVSAPSLFTNEKIFNNLFSIFRQYARRKLDKISHHSGVIVNRHVNTTFVRSKLKTFGISLNFLLRKLHPMDPAAATREIKTFTAFLRSCVVRVRLLCVSEIEYIFWTHMRMERYADVSFR